MYLAFHNHRVDDGAKVIGGHKLHNICDSCFWIHFDLTNVAARREGEIRRIVKRTFL